MMGRDGSGNVLAPNLSLKLNMLLQDFPQSQRKDELAQVTFLILRNISNLRQVYHFYCTLGHNRVQSTKSEMTRLQLWRFIKDSRIHHHGLSLPEMDRIIARCLEKTSVHQPTERLSLSDFLSSITVLSYVLYKDKIKASSKTNGKVAQDKLHPHVSSSSRRAPVPRSQTFLLPQCLQKLITDHIMQHSGRVKGGFLYDPRKAVNALLYMEGSWKVYRSLCDQQTREPTLMMRKLLLALKDFKIIGPHLSTDAFIKILASDNPAVSEGGVYNLEIEITFLEYFEALVGCAMTFVNEEMLQQPANFGAPRLQRRFSSGSAGSAGLGHSRPGSAYARRTSSRSSRTASSRSSSIRNIEEDMESVMEAQSDSSTVIADQDSQSGANAQDESMETTITGIDELQINDDGDARSPSQGASPSPSGRSFLFPDDDSDDEDDFNAAALMSPRSKGSSPEVITPEMQEKERQFTKWSSQLQIFFTRHLFPAWQKLEMLRREAARHRNKK